MEYEDNVMINLNIEGFGFFNYSKLDKKNILIW